MKYFNPFHSKQYQGSSEYIETDSPPVHEIGDFKAFSMPSRMDIVHRDTLIAQRVACSLESLERIAKGDDMYALQQNKQGKYVRPWNL